MNDLILDLYNSNCIKYGTFTLKNGETSSIYIDLKNIISYPYLINSICHFLYKKINYLQLNRICGVPYGALSMSSIISSNYNIPMIFVRKETKNYGLKKLVEGEYNENDKIVLIEDTITTGSSLLKVIDILEKCNLKIEKILVICDRRKNSNEPLKGYNVETLITLDEIITVIDNHNKLKKLNEKNIDCNKGKKLLEYININQSNKCISLNENLHFYLDKICILKIDNRIMEETYITTIKQLSNEYKFLLLDDSIQTPDQKDFFDLFTKKNKLYSWIDLIIIKDVNMGHIMPIIERIETDIGIIVEYTNDIITINVFKLLIERYKKYIVGTLNFDIKFNYIIDFSKDITYI